VHPSAPTTLPTSHPHTTQPLNPLPRKQQVLAKIAAHLRSRNAPQKQKQTNKTHKIYIFNPTTTSKFTNVIFD